MKSITTNHTVALMLAVLLAFFGVTTFASANHSGEEGEAESHATTAHHDEADHHDDATVTTTPVAVTISATGDRAAKIAQLITAMQQLVALLQHQLEHMEAEHEDNDEDHHE